MTVVYASNRKLYQYLPTTIGSLLHWHPDVKIYLLCEDDEIENLSNCKNISFLNVNNLSLPIDLNHPNANTKYTYFALIRCFLTKIIPDDKILWLDVDTLILDSISDLWNIDMTNLAVIGYPEGTLYARNFFPKLKKSRAYINSGVLLMNLKFIKNKKIDEEIIKILNSQNLTFPDQDAINLACDGYVGYLSAIYNFGPLCREIEKKNIKNPKIYHMTYYKLWDGYFPGLWGQYYREKL